VGQTRKSDGAIGTSGLSLKADIGRPGRYV
jgi:hypothetical protein